ncbi:hypothetical protein CIRG_04684 [Coccidioides immitis RMSCC 2394]|uniref:Uncharacterized protein n=1 Tax=Coccidioides immitis RMSCC 2394 TaxID=404692 RepID=A0A0J6YDN1_COCIT|nr:hypothetical protein CIRG_04684 [Coccidioides immitis RMSCC 2394]
MRGNRGLGISDSLTALDAATQEIAISALCLSVSSTAKARLISRTTARSWKESVIPESCPREGHIKVLSRPYFKAAVRIPAIASKTVEEMHKAATANIITIHVCRIFAPVSLRSFSAASERKGTLERVSKRKSENGVSGHVRSSLAVRPVETTKLNIKRETPEEKSANAADSAGRPGFRNN